MVTSSVLPFVAQKWVCKKVYLHKHTWLKTLSDPVIVSLSLLARVSVWCQVTAAEKTCVKTAT